MATLDCLFPWLMQLAYNYVKPSLSEDGSIQSEDAVIGCRTEGEDPFVPNDITLDEDNERIQIITGPNMAGKVLLSQCRCCDYGPGWRFVRLKQ